MTHVSTDTYTPDFVNYLELLIMVRVIIKIAIFQSKKHQQEVKELGKKQHSQQTQAFGENLVKSLHSKHLITSI